MNGSTFIVDGKGDGKTKFKTIREAVDKAKAMDRIVIQQGTYSEHILVNKALIIEGVGDVTIESHTRDVLTFICTTARLCNLNLKQKQKQDVNCVNVETGNIVLDHCDIRKNARAI